MTDCSSGLYPDVTPTSPVGALLDTIVVIRLPAPGINLGTRTGNESMKVTFRDVELVGCTGVYRRHEHAHVKVTHGAQGDVAISGGKWRDIGSLDVYFGAGTDEGAVFLASLMGQEEGPVGTVTVSDDQDGLDIDSNSWIASQSQDGRTWRFDGVHMPR